MKRVFEVKITQFELHYASQFPCEVSQIIYMNPSFLHLPHCFYNDK